MKIYKGNVRISSRKSRKIEIIIVLIIILVVIVLLINLFPGRKGTIEDFKEQSYAEDRVYEFVEGTILEELNPQGYKFKVTKGYDKEYYLVGQGESTKIVCDLTKNCDVYEITDITYFDSDQDVVSINENVNGERVTHSGDIVYQWNGKEYRTSDEFYSAQYE